MKKLSKKGKVICIFSVIVICILFFAFRYQIVNAYYNFRMLGVNKDITIYKSSGTNMGGYASSIYKYYIDIDKKKIYKVEEYEVWRPENSQQEGKKYFLKATKKLKDDELEEIIELTNLESDYTENTSGFSPLSNHAHYSIEYQGKEIELELSTASILEEVISDM